MDAAVSANTWPQYYVRSDVAPGWSMPYAIKALDSSEELLKFKRLIIGTLIPMLPFKVRVEASVKLPGVKAYHVSFPDELARRIRALYEDQHNLCDGTEDFIPHVSSSDEVPADLLSRAEGYQLQVSSLYLHQRGDHSAHHELSYRYELSDVLRQRILCLEHEERLLRWVTAHLREIVAFVRQAQPGDYTLYPQILGSRAQGYAHVLSDVDVNLVTAHPDRTEIARVVQDYYNARHALALVERRESRARYEGEPKPILRVQHLNTGLTGALNLDVAILTLEEGERQIALQEEGLRKLADGPVQRACLAHMRYLYAVGDNQAESAALTRALLDQGPH